MKKILLSGVAAFTLAFAAQAASAADIVTRVAPVSVLSSLTAGPGNDAEVTQDTNTGAIAIVDQAGGTAGSAHIDQLFNTGASANILQKDVGGGNEVNRALISQTLSGGSSVSIDQRHDGDTSNADSDGTTDNFARASQNNTFGTVANIRQWGGANAVGDIDNDAETWQSDVAGAVASIDQLGDGHSARVQQAFGADLAVAVVAQNGLVNKADVYQSGFDSDVFVSQDGAANEALVNQQGWYSVTWVTQNGTNNDAIVTQSSSNASVNVSQLGADNQALVNQLNGSGDAVTIIQ